MEGTSIYFPDDWTSRDHSYYGNGCPNEWGTDGEGGSTVACKSRMVDDGDGESQKNGTIYHFQASTSGSGRDIVDQNTNVPDTFCPLGWQLPYGGTGGDYYNKTKSWKFLSERYGIIDGTPSANNIIKYPLSQIYAGRYYWDLGRYYYQWSSGNYWTSTVDSAGAGFRTSIYPGFFKYSESTPKTRGHSIRCVSFGIRETSLYDHFCG